MPQSNLEHGSGSVLQPMRRAMKRMQQKVAPSMIICRSRGAEHSYLADSAYHMEYSRTA